MHVKTFLPFLRRGVIAVAAVALVACTTPQPPAGRAMPGASATPGGLAIPGVPAPPALPPKAQAAFVRPAAGPILARFDGKRSKGLDIAGNMGDAVLASADGRVVYVGGELRGYGNMVIVKHNETYLTAYAHARQILVKEKDVVRQGQKIAEMGDSGADRVKLHFEIRKQGVAVNPEPYLSGELR